MMAKFDCTNQAVEMTSWPTPLATENLDSAYAASVRVALNRLRAYIRDLLESRVAQMDDHVVS